MCGKRASGKILTPIHIIHTLPNATRCVYYYSCADIINDNYEILYVLINEKRIMRINAADIFCGSDPMRDQRERSKQKKTNE